MQKNTLIGIVFGITIPWILIFIFLSLLTPINWTKVPQILAVLNFASVAFPYDVPIFGYGYTIPLLIWLITGIFCGLCCKSVLKGVIITLLGLLVNILLFLLFFYLNPQYLPSSLSFLYSPENLGLLSGFSLNFLLNLVIFLGFYSLTLPSGILGGIIGGIISRTGLAE